MKRAIQGLKVLIAAALCVASIGVAQAATKKIGNYTWTYTTVKGGVQATCTGLTGPAQADDVEYRMMLRGVGLNEKELEILGISHAGE